MSVINASGGINYWVVNLPGPSLWPLETNSAVITQLTGSNAIKLVRAYDDTTEEFGNGSIILPPNFYTGGTIYFKAYVSAATAAASKNIGLTFGHRPISDSESWDQTYTDVDSGAIAIDATQDDVTLAEWSVANSTAGWAVNDMVDFRFARDPTVTDDLTGDMYWHTGCILIPLIGTF